MTGVVEEPKKQSIFARFTKGGDKKEGKKEKKPKKEKAPKQKKEKKTKKVAPEKEGSKKNFFGKEKKTPREELYAEIEQLKNALKMSEGELHDTRIRYNELQRWAQNPPVRR